VWSQLGKAQLQQSMVKEAIDSYIKVFGQLIGESVEQMKQCCITFFIPTGDKNLEIYVHSAARQ
jgi:hypothetical protein